MTWWMKNVMDGGGGGVGTGELEERQFTCGCEACVTQCSS